MYDDYMRPTMTLRAALDNRSHSHRRPHGFLEFFFASKNACTFLILREGMRLEVVLFRQHYSLKFWLVDRNKIVFLIREGILPAINF